MLFVNNNLIASYTGFILMTTKISLNVIQALSVENNNPMVLPVLAKIILNQSLD